MQTRCDFKPVYPSPQLVISDEVQSTFDSIPTKVNSGKWNFDSMQCVINWNYCILS